MIWMVFLKIVEPDILDHIGVIMCASCKMIAQKMAEEDVQSHGHAEIGTNVLMGCKQEHAQTLTVAEQQSTCLQFLKTAILL